MQTVAELLRELHFELVCVLVPPLLFSSASLQFINILSLIIMNYHSIHVTSHYNEWKAIHSLLRKWLPEVVIIITGIFVAGLLNFIVNDHCLLFIDHNELQYNNKHSILSCRSTTEFELIEFRFQFHNLCLYFYLTYPSLFNEQVFDRSL